MSPDVAATRTPPTPPRGRNALSGSTVASAEALTNHQCVDAADGGWYIYTHKLRIYYQSYIEREKCVEEFTVVVRENEKERRRILKERESE